jgi:hypothetical protein
MQKESLVPVMDRNGAPRWTRSTAQTLDDVKPLNGAGVVEAKSRIACIDIDALGTAADAGFWS